MADRRFYLQVPDGKIDLTRIGTNLKVSGTIMQGENETVVLWLPSAADSDPAHWVNLTPTDAEWSAIIAQSDDPKFYRPHPIPNLPHILVRKAEYEISSLVQQKVWARAEFGCQYCGRRMGDVALSVDHFIPLALGGANNMNNYLAACKRCNKLKGDTPPEEFCEKNFRGLGLYKYLANWLKEHSR